ncbi:hypothetical protein NDU88_001214 [Pleurodeles waltl]|uniref:Uncharacterized protein n=1 Tax=Pleurodeles waltl TaxID=8319 RepID=A0AAV7P4R8_PLEWA|nr:hypothetical protein NDU88_001214 [Pleurodeles waltl]
MNTNGPIFTGTALITQRNRASGAISSLHTAASLLGTMRLHPIRLRYPLALFTLRIKLRRLVALACLGPLDIKDINEKGQRPHSQALKVTKKEFIFWTEAVLFT